MPYVGEWAPVSGGPFNGAVWWRWRGELERLAGGRWRYRWKPYFDIWVFRGVLRGLREARPGTNDDCEQAEFVRRWPICAYTREQMNEMRAE